jgi:hypothetical protein
MDQLHILTNFTKGGLAGVFGTIVTQPIDYVKTIQQSTNNSKSMITIIRDTIKINPLLLYNGVLLRSGVNIISMGVGAVITNLFI